MKHKISLILLIIAIFPAFSFLLRPGEYWNMHDDMQMIRQLEMEKCLLDGQIPCRWSPDLGYGYGYPLFNFYPPMPYFVGQVFRLFGFSFATTVRLVATSQIILSATAMYLLASSIFGALGGLVGAIFYTYAPYHALNIFVRGAMNEAWAAVFFPLIFYFGRKLVYQPNLSSLLGLSFSYAGLLLSHNPMALIFTPFFSIWCLYWFLQHPTKKAVIYAFSSALLALGLSAFYTLPVLLESKYVQIDSMFQNYYHFSVHFTTLFQLFISSFWGDGASVWGPEDNMSFSVGYLHWIMPIVLAIYSLVIYRRQKRFHQTTIILIILSVLTLISIFMTHNKSTPIWLALEYVQKIQFPWRFLNLTTFFSSLTVAILPSLIQNKKVTVAIIILVIIVNLRFFTPIQHGPITDEQKFSGLAWTNQITSGIYDYLPKTARIAARGPAKEYIDETNPPTEYVISGQKHGTDWLFFNLYLPSDTQITISQLAFPGFKLYNSGEVIDYNIEPELGRITVDLPMGNHQLYLKLHDTPIRTISNYLSLTSLLLILTYYFGRFFVSWKKR